MSVDLFVDQLAFERLVAALENIEDRCFFDDLAAIAKISLRHLLHPFFDDGQIVLGKISRSDNVVIKAVTRIFHQRGADAELCSRKQIENGSSKQMSGRMAENLKPVAACQR